MAFDQPLEADNVGNNNILVSLVTRPIIGTLMWIIGDDNGDANNNNKKKKLDDETLQRGLHDMMILDVNNDDSRVDDCAITYSRQQPPSATTLPRLVRSDVSVALEGGAGEGHLSLRPRSSMTSCSDNSNNNQQQQQQGLPRGEKKRMSWSDNLVEYMDMESVRHEPPLRPCDSPILMAKPIKSAMTRSASLRSYPLIGGGGGGGQQQAAGSTEGDSERTLRYLPSGLDKGGGGLRMPTRPGHNSSSSDHQSSSGGIESPQWGWYINTTPPTPEMYHSRSSLKHHHSYHAAAAAAADKSSDQSSTTSATSSASSSNSDPATRGPNRVFQGLKAGSNRPRVGWPSVPL